MRIGQWVRNTIDGQVGQIESITQHHPQATPIFRVNSELFYADELYRVHGPVYFAVVGLIFAVVILSMIFGH